MTEIVKRLWLGAFLIAVISGILLASDRQSRRKPSEQPAGLADIGRARRIELIRYTESSISEELEQGLNEGLAAGGLVAGRDFVLAAKSAQGDMSLLPALVDRALSATPDLLVTLSTPTLQAALAKAPKIPVVFTFVADPFKAGAGTTDTDHLPNVTGVYTEAPYHEMVELITRYFPGIKRLGTLFTPAEVNSVSNKDKFVVEAQAHGLEVDLLALNGPAELADAARALSSRNIDAICQIIDNASSAGFAAIAQAAKSEKKPLFSFMSSALEDGAVLTVSRDYRQAGRDTADRVRRILAGADPGTIPFAPPSITTVRASAENAKAINLILPPELAQAMSSQL